MKHKICKLFSDCNIKLHQTQSIVEGLKSGGKGLATALTGYTDNNWQAPTYEQYQLNQTRDDEK